MNRGLTSSGTNGSSLCEGAIWARDPASNVTNPEAGWTIGDLFLKNVYAVFRSNPPSVGFAQLSDLAQSTNGACVCFYVLVPF